MINYSIMGSDKLLIKEQIKKIKNTLTGAFDTINIDLQDDGLVTLIEEIETFSFFSNTKFILCYNANLIKEDKGDTQLLTSLINRLKNPSEDLCLVLLFDNLDSKNKIHKEIKKFTTNVSIKNMDEKNTKEYVIDYLKDQGFSIVPNALEELLVRTSNAINLIITELNKLMIYTDDHKKITLKDVDLLVSKNIDDNVFSLVEAVLEKNKPLVMKLYRDMLINNIDEIAIIAILLNKFNEMYNVRVLINNRYDKDEVAQIFDVKPGRAFYMVKNANTASLANIKENIERLCRLEYEVKSGKIDKKIGLEIYLLS